MTLATVVLLAAIQGVAEVLPISRSGHGEVARLWLEPGAAATRYEVILHAATAAALAVAVRRRMRAAFAELPGALARPSLSGASPRARDAAVVALASAISIAVAWALRPWTGSLASDDAPLLTGIGLLVTALALASTALSPGSPLGPPGGSAGARPPRWSFTREASTAREAPGLGGAAVLGVVHGLGALPGASRVGAALTLLLWMGVRPLRALELAFAVTVPALLVASIDGLRNERGSAAEIGTAVLGMLVAFVSATAAIGAARVLVEKNRTFYLSAWVLAVGLATIAYARVAPAIQSYSRIEIPEWT